MLKAFHTEAHYNVYYEDEEQASILSSQFPSLSTMVHHLESTAVNAQSDSVLHGSTFRNVTFMESISSRSIHRSHIRSKSTETIQNTKNHLSELHIPKNTKGIRNENNKDVIKVILTLNIGGQSQEVEFDFHLIEDDPIQVSREMIDELKISEQTALEVSETIRGLVKTAKLVKSQDHSQQQYSQQLTQCSNYDQDVKIQDHSRGQYSQQLTQYSNYDHDNMYQKYQKWLQNIRTPEKEEQSLAMMNILDEDQSSFDNTSIGQNPIMEPPLNPPQSPTSVINHPNYAYDDIGLTSYTYAARDGENFNDNITPNVPHNSKNHSNLSFDEICGVPSLVCCGMSEFLGP